MASLAEFSSLSTFSLLCTTNSSYRTCSSSWVPLSFLRLHRRTNAASSSSSALNYSTQHLSTKKNNFPERFRRIIRSVAEETPLAPEEEEQPKEEEEAAVPDQATVSVSPSDVLTMFFQAEGTMSDSAVDKVTSALEQVENVSKLKVEIVEGIASVQLTKQTTVQATGVASNLVEVIQGCDFRLQTLNLRVCLVAWNPMSWESMREPLYFRLN